MEVTALNWRTVGLLLSTILAVSVDIEVLD